MSFDACMDTLPEQRIEELVWSMEGQSELTAAGRGNLMARWCMRKRPSLAVWGAWAGAVVAFFARPPPPSPHPLRALAPWAPARSTLEPGARMISAAVDPTQARFFMILSVTSGEALGSASTDGERAYLAERARIFEASGLRALRLRLVELAAAHAGVAPIEQLDYPLIIVGCQQAADLAVRPPRAGLATDRVARQLLRLCEWREVPKLGSQVRIGMTAQSYALQAVAVLVGGREADGADGVALSPVRCLAPARVPHPLAAHGFWGRSPACDREYIQNCTGFWLQLHAGSHTIIELGEEMRIPRDSDLP